MKKICYKVLMIISYIFRKLSVMFQKLSKASYCLAYNKFKD